MPFSTSPSITARRSAPAQKCSICSCASPMSTLALVEQLGDLALLGGELLGALVLERAHRDHRQARIDLHAGHRIAGVGAEEGLLEIGVGDRSRWRRRSACRAGRRPRPSRDSRRSPRRGRSRRRRTPGARRPARAGFPAPARWSRPGRCGRRPPCPRSPARRAPERSSFLASASVGANTMTLAPNALIASTLPLGGMPPASTTWPTPCLRADLDQLEQHRVHGDQVHAERLAGQRLGRRRSRASSRSGVIAPQAITPKPPALLIAADEVALGHPAHRAAQDRVFAAEEFGAARHQGGWSWDKLSSRAA